MVKYTELARRFYFGWKVRVRDGKERPCMRMPLICSDGLTRLVFLERPMRRLLAWDRQSRSGWCTFSVQRRPPNTDGHATASRTPSQHQRLDGVQAVDRVAEEVEANDLTRMP